MPVSEKQRAKLLEISRPAAVALMEDVEHLRECVKKSDAMKITPQEVRRLAVILRRILNDRDLLNVASPRIGKFLIRTSDNSSVVKQSRKNNNVKLEFSMCAAGPPLDLQLMRKILGPDAVPETECPDLDLPLHKFLGQPVLYLDGHWISRRETIKFAANIAHGAHSFAPKTAAEKTLARIRRCVSIVEKDGMSTMTIEMRSIKSGVSDFVYRPDAMDPILIILLATAIRLTETPHMDKLIASITEEIGK